MLSGPQKLELTHARCFTLDSYKRLARMHDGMSVSSADRVSPCWGNSTYTAPNVDYNQHIPQHIPQAMVAGEPYRLCHTPAARHITCLSLVPLDPFKQLLSKGKLTHEKHA